jgi:TolA-binding protein
LAIIVIVAASIYITNSRKQTQIEAATQFSEGLAMFRSGDLTTAEELFKMISDRYPSLREGIYASYFAGKCALAGGRNIDAVERFDTYLERSGKYPFFRDAALDGKGTALENEQRYNEAAQVYLDLARNIHSNHFMEQSFLRRAANNFKLSGQRERAIEIMEELVEKTTGFERLELEIELDILRG